MCEPRGLQEFEESLLQRLESFESPVDTDCAVAGLYAPNLAFLVDDERYAVRNAPVFKKHPVLPGHLFLQVTQKRVFDTVLLGEFLLCKW